MDEKISEYRDKTFLRDKDIAKALDVSPSCIRKQRYLRKNGEKHFFDIDAVYIGSSPRYRGADFSEWMKKFN